MNKILLCCTVILAFMFSQTIFANCQCEKSLNQMLQSISLDAEQKAKIKPILEKLKSDLEGAAVPMRDLESQLKQQVNAVTMNESAANDLNDKKAKLIGDMMKAKTTATYQVMNVLTPAQKTALQNQLAKVEEEIAAQYKNCKSEDN